MEKFINILEFLGITIVWSAITMVVITSALQVTKGL